MSTKKKTVYWTLVMSAMKTTYEILEVTTEKRRTVYGRIDNEATHKLKVDCFGKFDNREAAEGKIEQLVKLSNRWLPIIAAKNAEVDALRAQFYEELQALLK